MAKEKEDSVQSAVYPRWKLGIILALVVVALHATYEYATTDATKLGDGAKIVKHTPVKPGMVTRVTFDPLRESFELDVRQSGFTYLVVVNGDWNNPKMNSINHPVPHWGDGVRTLHISHAPGTPEMISHVKVTRTPK